MNLRITHVLFDPNLTSLKSTTDSPGDVERRRRSFIEQRPHIMYPAILLLGIALLIIGAFKHNTDWGKGAALIGAVGLLLSVLVGGPELIEAADDFRRGFQEGLAD